MERHTTSNPFMLVKEEDFPKVQCLLKTRLPRSSHVYNMVLSKNKFSDRMKIYTFNGELGEHSWIIGLSYREDMGADINISVPIHPIITDDIKEAFANSNLIDWNQPYLFPATDRSISRMLFEISAFIKGNSTRIFPCYLYYTEQSEALALEIEKTECGEIRKLDVEQGMEFMIKHWKHSRPGTKEYIEQIIAKNNALGIYIENKPVCAALTHVNGTIGMLNTSEPHRRKGYGLICMKSLIKELAENGFFPCSGAEMHNQASRALHEKIGMKISHVVDYIGSFGKQ